jgi:hypothetical protein
MTEPFTAGSAVQPSRRVTVGMAKLPTEGDQRVNAMNEYGKRIGRKKP